jgi:ABC-type uncharacterized transport system YnjBCD ATPase subunit
MSSSSASSSAEVPAPSASPLPASESVYLEQHPEVAVREASGVRFHIADDEADAAAIRDGVLHADQEKGKSADEIELQSVTVDQNGNGAGAAARRDSPSNSMTDSEKRAFKRQQSFLAHEDNVRTVLVWQNLTVSVPIRGTQERKLLLNSVSGSMTGGMWAIMGPSGCGHSSNDSRGSSVVPIDSGEAHVITLSSLSLSLLSGKSTLLNTLACRLDVNTHVTGEMRLNGRPYQSTELKKMSGYVMQDDLLNGHLTVRETLHYTAALRLPKSTTNKERDARVMEVINEMGLAGVQDVIVSAINTASWLHPLFEIACDSFVVTRVLFARLVIRRRRVSAAASVVASASAWSC